MATSDVLRSVLTNQLDATVARRSAEEILQDVPPPARGVQPDDLPEAYSLWQILEHIRVTQADYLSYCTNPDYTLPAWPDDYWPDTVAPPNDEAWTRSLQTVLSDLESVKEFVNHGEVDLSAEIPHADGESYHSRQYAQEIAAIADHNAYHLGQFVTVRRLLGVWPPAGLAAPEWEDDA